MDFNPELSAFQGVLISADNVHSFSRLSAKGGNEEQIEYVIRNMLKFLEQQNYISQNAVVEEKVDKVRKFAFYIILNADLQYIDQMTEMDGIDGVIWTIPTIPRCLMCEMLWELKMDTFVYETIAFSCPQLSLELAGALIDHLKYATPSESLQKLKILTTALYLQVCRLNFFNFPNDVLSDMLTVALNHFQVCLGYFIDPPNSYKLSSLKKDEQYRFKGVGLQTAILMIQECLAQYTSIQEFSPRNFNEIYQLTYTVGTYKEGPLPYLVCNSPNKPILECLDKCNEAILDKFKILVMDVSVDIFCAWSEFDMQGRSMQQHLGELCYNLRSKIMTINGLCEHEVVTMLQQISRKPADVSDLVNVSDAATIAENIKKEENTTEWLQAVIHKDKVYHDVALIELIMSNLHSLNEDESHELYKACTTHLNQYTQNLDSTKLLAIKAFQKCKLDVKNGILEQHFNEKCFNDTMESIQFTEMLTETFNKVIVEKDADLTDILTVFLQNPQKVFTKIITLSSESSQQAVIMLNAAKLLRKFSNHYYKEDTEPCIVRVAENVLENLILSLKDSNQQNLIKFLCGLKTNNIIPGTGLLLLIIMPKLHKGLLEKNVRQIHFQCKLLCEAFTLDELMPYRAPMLAMLAQILEVVRWKITTFTPDAPSALELALRLQIKLFDTYDGGIPEKEESWLKSKLKKLHPLNCYYYRRLWNPPGANYVETVSGKRLTGMDANQFLAWLTLILPTTVQSEWVKIWDSTTTLDENVRLKVIHEALIVLTTAQAANDAESTRIVWECLLHCYKNFVHIVRYKFFKEPLTDEQVVTAIQKVTSLANCIKEENSEQLSTIVMPLFAYLVSRKDDINLNLATDIPFQLGNKTFLAIVNKVFSNPNSSV